MKKTLNSLSVDWVILYTPSDCANSSKRSGSKHDHTTLRAAFDAINTRSPVILDIISKIGEKASAPLNPRGAGSASHTSVPIGPGGDSGAYAGIFSTLPRVSSTAPAMQPLMADREKLSMFFSRKLKTANTGPKLINRGNPFHIVNSSPNLQVIS